MIDSYIVVLQLKCYEDYHHKLRNPQRKVVVSEFLTYTRNKIKGHTYAIAKRK